MSDHRPVVMDSQGREVPEAWRDLEGAEHTSGTIRSRLDPLLASAADHTLATAPPPGAAAAPISGPPPPPFQIFRELGRGGMGIVYEAEQRSLCRRVALKTMRADVGGSIHDNAQRFVGEALVAARLEHPNIVPVHELGRDIAGNIFMAMKFVRGRSWEDILKGPDRADGGHLRDDLEILLRVADAIAFAHAQGVIHRDLKPENVMVGEFGEVLVMDWGLALDVSEEARRRRAAAPHARQPAGTPSFMSPELALGELDRQGPPTDVYLLGGIVYRLVTGEAPHKGATVVEALWAASKGEVEPAALRAPPGRKVPRALGQIIEHALEPDPARRYQTVPELALALREYLANAASMLLVEAALEDVRRVDADVVAGKMGPAEAFAELTAALAELRQAEKLWAANDAARDGAGETHLAFARAAIAFRELALAETHLALVPPATPGVPEVAAAVAAESARRAARRKKIELVLYAAGALAAIAVIFGVVEAVKYRKSERARQVRETAVHMMETLDYSDPIGRIEAYKGVAAVDPTFADAQTELVYAYLARAYELYPKDPTGTAAALAEAVVPADRAIALAPDDPIKYMDRAYVLQVSDDAAGAIGAYRKAAELDPEGPRGLAAAGDIALLEGRYADADRLLTQALDAKVPKETVTFDRARARFAIGDLAGAAADCEAVLKIIPYDPWYMSLRVAIFLAEGRDREAADRLLLGLRFAPQEPRLIALAGYLAARHGDVERATALDARARDLQRQYRGAYLDTPAWRALAGAPGHAGEVGRAAMLDDDLGKLAAARQPDIGPTLRRRGEERLARGEVELALADSDRALAEDPSDGPARLLRGLCYARLGHKAGARNDIGLAVTLAPHRADEARKALAEVEK